MCPGITLVLESPGGGRLLLAARRTDNYFHYLDIDILSVGFRLKEKETIRRKDVEYVSR